MVDDDSTRAMKLETSAERKLASRSRKELSQKVTRLPFVQIPNLDIRMIPKKTLVVRSKRTLAREEVLARLISTDSPSLIFSPQRSGLSLLVITPETTVHRFAVVRVTVKRRIVGALNSSLFEEACFRFRGTTNRVQVN